MSNTYFKTLSVCMLISVSLLAATTFLHLPPWVALICGAAPLSYYHLGFLTPRAKSGLNQAAIDSVYYFGFLVTIAALGVSAVTVALNGAAANVNTVVYQFGVGLFATGYAVVARMHLASLGSPLDAVSPEAIMDRYIKRSLDMVDNVDTAVVRLSDFSQTVMTKTSEVTETARNAAEKVMLDVARVFEQEMKSTLASAREGLIEIRGLVSDTSFVAEREELARSIKATLAVSTELNKALAEYAARSREGAMVTQQSINTSTSLDESLSRLNKNIHELSGEDGALFKSTMALKSAAAAVTEGSDAVGTVVTSIQGISEDVAATGPAFKSMRTLAKKSMDQLEALAGISDRLNAAMSNISETATASGTLADELHRVGAALPLLALNVDKLSERLERAGDSTQRLEQQLTGLPARVAGVQVLSTSIETLGAQVHSALGRVSEGIAMTAASAQNLSDNNIGSTKAIEGVSLLLSQASALGETVTSLRQLFEGLAGSVRSTQTALSDSSTVIKTAVYSSTSALEADVKRSSEAATLLVDRLVRVADGVIARTQEQQRLAV